MTGPVVDRAAVQIVAELSQFSRQMQNGVDRQLRQTQQVATQTVDSIERGFSTMAREINRNMTQTVDVTLIASRNMTSSMNAAASRITSAMTNSTLQIDRRFDELMNHLRTQASQMGQSMQSAANQGNQGISSLIGGGGGGGGIMGLISSIPGVGVAVGFMSGIFGAKFAQMTGMVSNFISKIEQYGQEFIRLGITTSVNWEQQTLKFKALTGSVEEGNKIFAELKEFAAFTPFELSDILPAAVRFISFAKTVGMTNAQLKDYLTITGGIASLLGENGGNYTIQQLSMVFGQIASKGKLAYEEVMQISEALPGFSGVAVIAAHYGISTAKAQDMLSKGAINAKDGVAILLEGMRKFPGVATAMEEQSRTLGGQWSTLKDTLAAEAEKFVAPFIPSIKKGIDWLSTVAFPKIDEWIQKIKDYLKDVGADVPGLVAHFAKLDLKELVTDAKNFVNILVEHKAEIKEIIDLIIIGVQMMIQSFLIASDVFQNLTSVFLDSFQNMMALTQIFVTQFLVALDMILDSAVAAFGWVPGLGDKLRAAQQAVRNLQGQAKDLFNDLRTGAPITITTAGALEAIARVKAAVGDLRRNVGAGMALTYSQYYYSGGHAAGGIEMPGGAPFWVGEEGPELMRYRTNGLLEIMSSQKSQAYVSQIAKGGDGASIYAPISITVNASPGMNEAMLAEKVGDEVKKALSGDSLTRIVDEGHRINQFAYSQRIRG